MAEKHDNGVRIVRVANRSIISLRVARKSLDDALGRFPLSAPLQTTDRELRSFWIAPDHWLLVSDSVPPGAIVEHCRETLADILHNAVDQSAGLAVFQLAGHRARGLLATGSGVDFRPSQFPAGACCRTRLAQVAAIVVARAVDDLEIYVDRSYASYLGAWLEDSNTMPDLRRAGAEK